MEYRTLGDATGKNVGEKDIRPPCSRRSLEESDCGERLYENEGWERNRKEGYKEVSERVWLNTIKNHGLKNAGWSGGASNCRRDKGYSGKRHSWILDM